MIVIYDKGGGNFAETALAVAKALFGESNVVHGFAYPDQLPQAFTENESNYVVAHLSETQWTLLRQSWPEQVRALIRVSSQGAGGMPSYAPPIEVDGGGWILHATQRASDITVTEWQVIFKAIADWKRGSQNSPLSQLVYPLYKNYEPTLAFRLLCEAKRACEDKAQKEDFNGTGITIHAPMRIEDWLAPFGKTPGDANAIEHVAGLIGSGDVKAMAKAVLDAANANGNTLKNTIEIFLNPPANPPVQS